MKKLKEYATVCTIGSVGYSLIEILWRGFTHWTMSLTGGVGFLLLYLMEFRMAGKTLLKKCAAGCAVLTSIEFVVGCIVNKIMRLNVWDYSRCPGNLMGQICPLYSALWFLLCIPVLPLSQKIRGRLHREPRRALPKSLPGNNKTAA